ncbi:hypothetical protein [Desulfomonile tiedjei]|uniref:Uncharacterized protein n=1 Tax=Desulfomonile tiedjei (strain ATCC 49306 / DSM 6799 / DCB-1) TaxID=706587 RepID=I4C356_DESTA|nr:hypothetical protein [Desulfomonile tiedjei]AFM23997.1 hypothetical protein Desti_1284 [Desulfomonile tiedjei DSM 6799]
MAAKNKGGQDLPEEMAGHIEDTDTFETEEGPVVIASAKDIPRPTTTLTTHVKGKVGKMTVSLLADASSVLSLEEVDRINQSPGEARTPVLSVIQALLAKSGGTMQIESLVPEVKKHWNRLFPTSPYSPEEFIYIIVRNSDNLRVS